MRNPVFNTRMSSLIHTSKTTTENKSELETNRKKHTDIRLKNRMPNTRKKTGISEVVYTIKRLKRAWADHTMQ